MSTSRGSGNRTRPQKHQNRTAFKNDLHDTSKRTKTINSLDISGVCKRCKEIIDWKIKYKKYKPLTAPRKCVTCSQKTVKHAYHVLCKPCAEQKKICAKCCTSIEHKESIDIGFSTTELAERFKTLPERKRRTMLRFLKKYDDNLQKISPQVMTNIEEMLAKNSLNFDDEDDDDDDLNAFLDDDCNESESDVDKNV